MARDMMYECQKKTKFKVDGKILWKWKDTTVKGLSKGENPNLRCRHCHGPVLVALQQQDHGALDHVRHQRTQDAECCVGGSIYEGEHKMSTAPVDPELPIFGED